MSKFDENIFGSFKFSNLLEEIYNNQHKKEEQLKSLIGQLKNLINDVGDATLIVPLIREYMDLGIKNDGKLVEIATIVQRVINSSTSSNSDGGLGMTEAEKEEILKSINELEEDGQIEE